MRRQKTLNNNNYSTQTRAQQENIKNKTYQTTEALPVQQPQETNQPINTS